jgi:hypothetical protein
MEGLRVVFLRFCAVPFSFLAFSVRLRFVLEDEPVEFDDEDGSDSNISSSSWFSFLVEFRITFVGFFASRPFAECRSEDEVERD